MTMELWESLILIQRPHHSHGLSKFASGLPLGGRPKANLGKPWNIIYSLLYRKFSSIDYFLGPLGLHLLVWNELGRSQPFQPMRDLSVQWSRAFNLVCEVASIVIVLMGCSMISPNLWIMFVSWKSMPIIFWSCSAEHDMVAVECGQAMLERALPYLWIKNHVLIGEWDSIIIVDVVGLDFAKISSLSLGLHWSLSLHHRSWAIMPRPPLLHGWCVDKPWGGPLQYGNVCHGEQGFLRR
jgi:hypothetical protein